MKKLARISVWGAGLCTLLLSAAGPSFAQTPRGQFDGDGIFGSDTVIDVRAEVDCSRRAAFCVNGPVNSGNVSHAENVHIGGNANHSGSPDNQNGNTNSSNESHGATSKTDNDMQIIGRGGDQRL